MQGILISTAQPTTRAEPRDLDAIRGVYIGVGLGVFCWGLLIGAAWLAISLL